jgi:hypothetical protein
VFVTEQLHSGANVQLALHGVLISPVVRGVVAHYDVYHSRFSVRHLVLAENKVLRAILAVGDHC